MANRVPVTILTGFLGSGKTTLLNHLLTENHGKKFAIIENEFGEVGVDDALLTRKGSKFDAEEEIVEMNNGCICCTVRGDLIRIIQQILKRSTGKRKLDGIIIETTGLADPAPVAQTFFVDDTIAKKCKLDGIITVVDAKHILQHLLEVKPEGVENESVEQVAFADRILLNKTDLVASEDLDAIKKQIRSINASAQIVECQQCRVDPSLLLNIESFDLDKILVKEPDFLENTDHIHDTSVMSIGFQSTDVINIRLLQDWIQEMLMTKGNDLLRYKGVINVVGMDNKFVFQGVHMLFDGGFVETKWERDEPRETRFVFIGKNLDREQLTKDFLACKALPLRFKVGDRVLARVETGFEPGKIVKVWDQGNPYRIRLEKTRDDVWGSLDDDSLVRSASPLTA
uniref:CobW C-terminal domain-containing protein n=1 Tax=Globisporangium ultimum (strain ATCC 200006 / CBS 805.95 / DAOM BR144) TaxID=431595 RepID=K3X878_GLOUD